MVGGVTCQHAPHAVCRSETISASRGPRGLVEGARLHRVIPGAQFRSQVSPERARKITDRAKSDCHHHRNHSNRPVTVIFTVAVERSSGRRVARSNPHVNGKQVACSQIANVMERPYNSLGKHFLWGDLGNTLPAPDPHTINAQSSVHIGLHNSLKNGCRVPQRTLHII